MAAAFDDSATPFDGAYVFDVGNPFVPGPLPPPAPEQGAGGFSTHDLLTPQNILVPLGSRWDREEAERWTSRVRREREDARREESRIDEETIAILLTLLVD